MHRSLFLFALFLAISLWVLAVPLYALTAVAGGDLAAAQPVAAAAAPSIMAWFTANMPYILGLALVVSEGLSVTPWFQGNGILDTIIKSLKALTGKPANGGG